ncbi:MAG: NAD(P)-dependent oxidoreductase, partial [Pseudomonadota bacterium]
TSFRNFLSDEAHARSGNWEANGNAPLSRSADNRRVGILGLGRIGQAIARRCHFGFGMEVHYVSRSEKSLAFPVTRAPDLVALAGAVDFLVVAVPGGTETRHLIDAAVFEAMQPHAHLVNIARGDVVDEAALVQALEAGQIAGAGLDVYEFEPDVPEALCTMEQVTLLPHLGTAAREVRVDMGLMAVANVAAFLRGAPLPNPV